MKWTKGLAWLVGAAATAALAYVLSDDDEGPPPMPYIGPGARVHVIGDSIGVGLAATLAAAGIPYTTSAEGGTRIDQWTDRNVLPDGEPPDLLIVSLGSNDAFMPSGESYREQIEDMWDQLEDAEVPTIWVLPPGDASRIKASLIREQIVTSLAGRQTDAPLYTLWTSDGPRLEPRPDGGTRATPPGPAVDIQADGVHPSPEGYRELLALLRGLTLDEA